jgi:hypothetical protein
VAAGAADRAADLLVVTGPPGAGKSTAASLAAAAFSSSAVVRGDDFFAFLASGAVAPWLPASRTQNELVLRAAGAAVGTLVRGGMTVLYDGILGPWFLPEFTAAAGVAELHYAVLLPPLATCLTRVGVRTGHDVPAAEATRHMHAAFVAAAIELRHLVVEPRLAPQELADLLLRRYREGQLLHRA